MKTLIVNGQKIQVSCHSLGELIESYRLNREHVVAEVNGCIIDRSEWDQYHLPAGATVELVHFVGGG